MLIEEVPLDIDMQAKQRSGLATASLVCSLIICCPLVTILAPILGIIALIKLNGKPELKGKGFAWSGIIIGIVATAVWIVVSVFVVNIVITMIEDAERIVTTTITAGYEGDYEAFRAELTAQSSTVTDEDIQEFIEELQARYGSFDTIRFNKEQQRSQLVPPTGEYPLPVHLVFETVDVSAEIMVRFNPDFTFKINCFKIFDSNNGDLVFPKDSVCANGT